VLLNGNHAEIAKWREQQSLERTRARQSSPHSPNADAR